MPVQNRGEAGASSLGVHGRKSPASLSFLSCGSGGGWQRQRCAWSASALPRELLCSFCHWSGRAQHRSGLPRTRGLNPRSSGAPTSGHQSSVWWYVYIFASSGLASHRWGQSGSHIECPLLVGNRRTGRYPLRTLEPLESCNLIGTCQSSCSFRERCLSHSRPHFEFSPGGWSSAKKFLFRRPLSSSPPAQVRPIEAEKRPLRGIGHQLQQVNKRLFGRGISLFCRYKFLANLVFFKQ